MSLLKPAYEKKNEYWSTSFFKGAVLIFGIEAYGCFLIEIPHGGLFPWDWALTMNFSCKSLDWEGNLKKTDLKIRGAHGFGQLFS